MYFQSSSLALILFLSRTVSATKPFIYNNDTFLLHGKPYQIIGGQMDPQRIPYQYWHDRLIKAKAMGLNTIFSYVFWDQVQPTPETWDFSGRNDVAGYFRTAQEVGLRVVLRAGPYIDGEHEWGGFPAWLLEVPGMVVRSYNAPFLNASKTYLDRLALELEPLLITNGGPIIMAQIENEYGSYGTNEGADLMYKESLRDIFQDAFKGMTFYTNDGQVEEDIVNGQVLGILAETDGDPQIGFAARDQYADPSCQGPHLDGEYYVTYFDSWSSNEEHETLSGQPDIIQTIQDDLALTLANNDSFNIYMFHGGTNFGLQNGALYAAIDGDVADGWEPVTTSYDYGAPLDESGRTNDIFDAIRQTIGAHVGINTIPAVPNNTKPISIPAIKLAPVAALFDVLPPPTSAKAPLNMEALGQSHGFTLYRHTVRFHTNGTLKPGDYPRDRVMVYVNGKRVGIIDGSYEGSYIQFPQVVTLDLKPHDTLDLLVENMGRVSYGYRLPDQRKGIVGNVTIGSTVLHDWSMFPLSLASPPLAEVNSFAEVKEPQSSGPVFYAGVFDVEEIGDTFLDLPGWTKGLVWVNGENLGRYWIVGPQQTLYLPGCYLKQVGNEITIVALEPNESQGEVRGITTRNWGNHPDPDAP